MLQVAPGWVVPAADLELKFVRSSGPGGQNVNKVATKVQLRLKLATAALNAGQKQRLMVAYPSHVSADGDFILTADRFRSQPRNQRDAEERLASMLLAIRTPPRRVATRPSRRAKARRVADKRARSDTKAQRRRPSDG